MTGSRQRVLVIGTGSIGERHLRCFQATGRAELSFVEINDSLRQAIAERYAVPSFTSLDAALAAAPLPDAAVVAVPAPWHVAIATRLVELGIHVLIEKPLSTSLDGLDVLQAAVEQHRVTVGVAYVLRHQPLLAGLRQALLSGRFGRPVEVVGVTGQHFPIYRPAYRTIYYRDRAAGGGAIQDALTHMINAGEWLVGPVTRLVTDAAHQVLEGVEVEDTAHVLARHGQVLASYSLNQHQAPNEFTLTVVCERGTARCELHANRWRWMTTPGSDWTDESIAPPERDSLFITQANQFLDAIQGCVEVACSLTEGVQTLKVNLAALASLAHGGWQELS